MKQQNPLRILIASDHPLFQRSLSLIISRQPDLEVVGEASTGAEAKEGAARLRPDMVILDTRLPDESGIEVGREIRSENPGSKVLLLTSYSDDHAVIGAVIAGAAGYLLKEMRSQEILGAIRQAGRGQPLLQPAIVQRVLDRVKTATYEDELGRLTPQEHDILELIAAGNTNKEIIAAIPLDETTLKSHINSILCKLEITCRHQAVIYMAEWRVQHTFRVEVFG